MNVKGAMKPFRFVGLGNKYLKITVVCQGNKKQYIMEIK